MHFQNSLFHFALSSTEDNVNTAMTRLGGCKLHVLWDSKIRFNKTTALYSICTCCMAYYNSIKTWV